MNIHIFRTGKSRYRRSFSQWFVSYLQLVPLAAVAITFAVLLGPPALPAQNSQNRQIPRTTDGKPDLSGFWQVISSADWNIQDHSAEKGIPGGQGIVVGNEIPYLPAAAEKKKANYAHRDAEDPALKSYVPGVPRIVYTPFPFQIVQTPTETAILYEYVHAVRHLYTNGNQHPSGHIDFWLGDSRAHWEGDSLVVDVTDFGDQSWFDHSGNFHSDALHVVERYTLVDPDHINYEATIEDPKTFTRPWKIEVILYRHIEKNFQLLDYEGYAFDYEKYYP